MKNICYLYNILFITTFSLLSNIVFANNQYKQNPEDLMLGEVMAIAYSGFRQGQHPDRGNGAINPNNVQILEDLQILQKSGFKLIRVYDSKQNSQAALELIKKYKLNIKVVLGVWLSAEVSNHKGCPWLKKPIPNNVLSANTIANKIEVETAIKIANKYPETVVAVSVGNETLVDWNDHMVSIDSIINYVRQVKSSIKQPVTVADNYYWWATKGEKLAKELDFIGVHTYPIWEGKTIDEALKFTTQNIEMVKRALPDSRIVIFEAGWATTAIEFGARANEKNQEIYYNQIRNWAKNTNTTVFFFEAFDEPWKGDLIKTKGAEKHWGLFFVDRSPKKIMR